MVANEDYHLLLITISILICITNCLVIALFLTHPSLRSTGNYILFSLAISDLAVGLFGIPVNIACELVGGWSRCLAAYNVNRFIAVSTVYHILWITLEKYFAIVHPFRHKSYFDKTKVKYICLCTWLVSMLLSLLELGWLTRHDNPYVDYPDDIKRKDFIYNAFIFAAVFVAPITIIAFAYATIFQRIVRQHSNVFLRKHAVVLRRASPRVRVPQNVKSAMLFFIVVLVFILGWFWWFFTVIYYNLLKERDYPSHDLIKCFILLRDSTSFVNPILYTFFKRDFRKAALALLKIPMCKSRSNVTRVSPQR